MGFDLRSVSGEQFWMNNTGWRYLLTLAEAHGFRWPANADDEENQALTADEAVLLANVIERQLGDEGSAALTSKISQELTKLLVIPSSSPQFRNDPIQITAQSVDHWREFVQFARKGGFSLSY
jgi:hypothetical protein